MSAKNKKSELREKIAEQREQAAKAAKRRKLFTQLGIVLGALVIVGIIVAIVVVATSGTPDDASGDATPPVGQTATVTVAGSPTTLEITDTGVALGDSAAPVQIDLFEDFSCPHCKDYDAAAGYAFLQLAAEGDAVVNYNPIQFVTAYGVRGGSTAMCVADGQPELWTTVHTAIFANQAQGTNNWRTGEFRDFAQELGVTDEDTLNCIFEGRYMNWIGLNTAAAQAAGVTGTPSLFIDGQQAELIDGATLIQAVRELATAE